MDFLGQYIGVTSPLMWEGQSSYTAKAQWLKSSSRLVTTPNNHIDEHLWTSSVGKNGSCHCFGYIIQTYSGEYISPYSRNLCMFDQLPEYLTFLFVKLRRHFRRRLEYLISIERGAQPMAFVGGRDPGCLYCGGVTRLLVFRETTYS